MEPAVHYVTTVDGVRIAYTVTGNGSPHVFCDDPISSHVQLEWSHSLLSRVFAEFTSHTTLIQFDPRGSGLSDRVQPQSVDESVRDY